MRTQIIGTGLKGLIGTKIVEQLSNYDFLSMDVSDPNNPVDITKADQVMSVIGQSSAEFVLHLAAFTDVTAAWQQKDDKSGLAYLVNVEGTKNVVAACEAHHKHLIHLSTAFVFSGDKTEPYLETDPMNPIEWYGQTKAWAEEVVQGSSAPWTILRIDFPFRSDPFPKPDIVTKTLQSIEKGYGLFSNHYFGPTYVEDLVKVIDWVIRTKKTGLFHSSSGEKWTDFEFGQALAEALSLTTEVKSGNLDEYLKTLQRPYQRNTSLNCDKLIGELDFTLTPVAEALKTISR